MRIVLLRQCSVNLMYVKPLVDHQAKVIFSTVNLYDDAQPPKLTAAQRRRLRRKKGKEAQKAQQAPTQDQLDSFIEDITPMFEEEQPAAEAVRNSPIPAPSKPESTITSRIQAESVIHEALPDLTGHPRKGMKIAYKTLELTTDYQPVISDVKEAIVMGLSADKHLITLQRLSNNVFLSNEGEDVPLGKFELPCEEDFHSETSDTVTVDLLSLMSIKVIPS